MSRISVVLPTFNRAPTLGRALTSIYGQTRPPDEVIVVDDASTDATPDVVARFNGARLVRLDNNGGAAHARNTGAQLASGDLIAFQDSDDVWAAHKLEVQEQLLNSSPDVDLVCTGVTVRERNGTIAYHGRPRLRPPAGWDLDDVQTYAFSTCTWMIRRTALLESGMFDEALPNCEDLDLLARMLRERIIEVIDEPLTIKYNQSDSLDSDCGRTSHSYATLFERHSRLWAESPSAAIKTQLRLANLHTRDGDMAATRRALRRAIAVRPSDLRLWLRLATSLLGRATYRRLRRLSSGQN